jgi:hypothetical protein
MSWLDHSTYWEELFAKKNKSIVEKIMLSKFLKKHEKTQDQYAWLRPSMYWKKLKEKVYRTEMEQIMMEVYKKHNVMYKCRYGSTCHNKSCDYIHPSQLGYFDALYVQKKMPCRYETEDTACYKKCADIFGKYCMYQHCTHHNCLTIISCDQYDCQGHCPDCV